MGDGVGSGIEVYWEEGVELEFGELECVVRFFL